MTPPSAIQDFEYDGSSMIGWNTLGASPSYNFLTIPGGAALAGSFTSGGTTTTWVPVIDASGSTLGLVNAASPQSGMATTYTYDPSGTPTASGTANEWPFQYQGREKEFTDPGPYYYSGTGQLYSPQFVRSLTEAGQTSASGTCGGPGANALAATSGGGGPDVGGNAVIGTEAGGGVGAGLVALGLIWVADGTTGGPLTGAAIVATVVDALVQGFLDLFGGGSDTPPTPRKLLHGRHPLYPVILGVAEGEIPDEVSAGKPQFSGDVQWDGMLPLQKVTPAPPSACSQYDAECSATPADAYACAAGDCCRDFGNNVAANCIRGCLLDFEASVQACGSGVGANRFGGHVICYVACGFPPGFLSHVTGPACVKLAPNLF